VGSVPPPVAGESVAQSPAVSMVNTVKDTIKTRRVAVLAEGGVSGVDLSQVRAALVAEGAQVEIVATALGKISTTDGSALDVDKSLLIAGSIMYDAVLIPGGAASVAALRRSGDAVHFINEAFRHSKPIGAIGEGVELILDSNISGVDLASGAPADVVVDKGVVTTRSPSDLRPFIAALIQAIAQHRHWGREIAVVPA
jgi:catalase